MTWGGGPGQCLARSMGREEAGSPHPKKHPRSGYSVVSWAGQSTTHSLGQSRSREMRDGRKKALGVTGLWGVCPGAASLPQLWGIRLFLTSLPLVTGV